MKKKRYNKFVIRNQIINAARNYSRYLVGKTFAYIFDNRFVEVIYRKSEFLHLTGVDTNLNAKEFFKEAVNGTLSEKQFWFSARHPYELCSMKMLQLNNLEKIINSEILIDEIITTRTTTFKFGLTDLCFTLCLDHDIDKKGLQKSSYYIAKSLRAEDCLKRCNEVYSVDSILERLTSEKYYTRINFLEKDSSIDKIPNSIKEKINPMLLCKLELK